MGIFARLGTLIKSNINDLISRSEDPEKMLNQVLLDMQQQLVDAKKSVAVAIADEKKLQKQHLSEVDKAKEWERKAMVAVRATPPPAEPGANLPPSSVGCRRSRGKPWAMSGLVYADLLRSLAWSLRLVRVCGVPLPTPRGASSGRQRCTLDYSVYDATVPSGLLVRR